MVEKDEQGNNIALWTIDAIVTPTTGPTKLYYRYYDALRARPEEEDEFEYTLTTEIPGRWFSFNLPDNMSLQLPNQQDCVVDSGHDPLEMKDKESIDAQPRLRRSNRRRKAYEYYY